MVNETKPFWFKRLPVLASHPAVWASHIAQHWNMEAFRPQNPMDPEKVRLALRHFMPELLPEYEALLSVTPDRPGEAQLLAMYNLPPFFSGCSNSISHRLGHHTLIRNYDFSLDGFSGVFRYEPLPDGGWIMGSAEGGWGYLDGLNHHGLAAAITFGGDFTVGNGFSIPLIVRYLLATSATVPEAVERLNSIPHRLVQNISLLDRMGCFSVVYTSPEGVSAADGLICCTNHQRQVQDSAHDEHRTVERFDHLLRMGGAISPQDFHKEPLYHRKFSNHFGTLYTVEIDPVTETVHYHWPEGQQLLATPASSEAEINILLSEN
ncbi:C45 family autoproteolytic acyltransferase/hydolase [Paenibacillus sp. OAE614]|uniref:C45 family autoproteolytic acyltransferase/hydolase n=1 Tax=Paenibacillus sp. OAE614 TaxID=2663804 RepID=UPI00178AFA0A